VQADYSNPTALAIPHEREATCCFVDLMRRDAEIEQQTIQKGATVAIVVAGQAAAHGA